MNSSENSADERVIIQVIGFGKAGQLLCDYFEKNGITGVKYFTEVNDDYAHSVAINSVSNLAFEPAIVQSSNSQIIKASDLNFYLVDESELCVQMDIIEQYRDRTCLNCLIILNHNSNPENYSKKLKDWLNKMDSVLLLPFSPYHDIPYLIDQKAMAYRYVKGVSESITRTGMICVDYSDIYTVLSKSGVCIIGTAYTMGKNTAHNTLMKIISGPAFKDIIMSETRGVLLNIASGPDFSFDELEKTLGCLKNILTDSYEAGIVVASPIDQKMTSKIQVTLIAAMGNI